MSGESRESGVKRLRVGEDAAIGTLLAWVREPHERMTLSLDRESLFGLASTLQLVLRHPQLPTHVTRQTRTLLFALRSLMPPEIQAISRMGDDRANDVPIDEERS